MNVELTKLEAIFAEAAGITDEAVRAGYLDKACLGGTDLRRRVEALLAAHDNSGSFLHLPTLNSNDSLVESTERPGARIGRYKLLEQLGEGGFGVVFMAEQEEPVRRLVAVKVIKLGMDTEQIVARFEAERQALAIMDHSNVAKVFDAGATSTGRPYFVMELVNGLPITEYCDREHLSIEQRLELFSQVCQAVQHAHQKGLIHRDIKPSNVLVTTQDGRPVVKVIDFGIAKAMQSRLTEKTLFTDFRQLVGTPAYMSPEQVAGGLDIDTRSDVYSLGVMLYELLTGCPPFDPKEMRSKTFAEIQHLICEVEPLRPSNRVSKCSDMLSGVAAQRATEPQKLASVIRGELDWIVMRCLEKDRARRYETPSALARDMDRYLCDEPVAACPPSAIYRMRKLVSRNRNLVAVVGIMLFLIMLLGGGSVWAIRDRSNRQAALRQEILNALDEVRGWYERENWNEALASLKQAERLIAAGVPAPTLASRIKSWRADLETIVRLDEIVLSNSDGLQWDDSESINANYEFEFRTLGIDIDALSLPEAASCIRARRIRCQLTQALDHWAQFRLNISYDEKKRQWIKPIEWCRRPLAIARLADSDEYHSRVRQAIEKWELAELVELTKLPAARNLPVSTLRLAARELYYSQGGQFRDQAGDILKLAQSARPDDFWINFTLATHLASAVWTTADGQSSAETIEDALRFATASVALRPHNARVRLLLVHLLMRSGRLEQKDLDEAETICRNAVQANPNDASAQNDLGDVLYLQRKFDAAAACFRTALEQAPQSAQLHLKLGLALQAQGKFKEASAAWHIASQLIDDDASRLNQLAWLMATISDPEPGDFQRAVELATKAVELAPRNGNGWNTLGVANYRAGNWQSALEALEIATQLRHGGDATDWVFLAMANWQLKRMAEARKWYDKAAEWIDKNAEQDEELRRYRREAAELLGI